VSQPDADARAVIAHFQRILGTDGSVLHMQSLQDDVLTVVYRAGDCDTCELAPQDLAGMMQELLARRGSAIRRVALSS
jgi:hypothetical protein